jgi:hypothetical protein
MIGLKGSVRGGYVVNAPQLAPNATGSGTVAVGTGVYRNKRLHSGRWWRVWYGLSRRHMGRGEVAYLWRAWDGGEEALPPCQIALSATAGTGLELTE